jgi:hypothetical protein
MTEKWSEAQSLNTLSVPGSEAQTTLSVPSQPANNASLLQSVCNICISLFGFYTNPTKTDCQNSAFYLETGLWLHYTNS